MIFFKTETNSYTDVSIITLTGLIHWNPEDHAYRTERLNQPNCINLPTSFTISGQQFTGPWYLSYLEQYRGAYKGQINKANNTVGWGKDRANVNYQPDASKQRVRQGEAGFCPAKVLNSFPFLPISYISKTIGWIHLLFHSVTVIFQEFPLQDGEDMSLLIRNKAHGDVCGILWENDELKCQAGDEYCQYFVIVTQQCAKSGKLFPCFQKSI